MVTIVVWLLLGIILGGILAYTPKCVCGHRGCWHMPEKPTQCFKCECKEFIKK